MDFDAGVFRWLVSMNEIEADPNKNQNLEDLEMLAWRIKASVKYPV